MNLSKLKIPRYISYNYDLLSDEMEKLVYDCPSYQAYKLQIKERHFETNTGEINFLIRDKSNNLKYILLYCYMNEPEHIFKFDYYINDIIKMPSKELVRIEPMVDAEIADLYVKDLIANYINKNYKLI